MLSKNSSSRSRCNHATPRSANRQRDSSRDPGLAGSTNKDIARVLLTSEQVVKNYLRTAFDKLGVWTRLNWLSTCAHGGLNWHVQLGNGMGQSAAWTPPSATRLRFPGATPRTTISAPQAQLCREFMRCASESAPGAAHRPAPTSTSIRVGEGSSRRNGFHMVAWPRCFPPSVASSSATDLSRVFSVQ